MSHVFRVHQQVDLPVHRDGHLSGHNVVFGILVVCGVEAEEVRVGLTDLVRVQRPERSVRAGVAEIKSKLSRLHLNRHRIR